MQNTPLPSSSDEQHARAAGEMLFPFAENRPPPPEEKEFDLIEHAQGVHTRIALPSYDDLTNDVKPNYLRFLHNLRERCLEHKQKGKKVIIVLGTGGTFQSAETDHGMAPQGNLKESFDALGLPEDPAIHLELCDLMKLDSSQMNVDHWRFLADMIILLEDTASDAYDSLVITHGTDTMSRGASYLSFMLQGFPKSIIFTGSQEAARKKDTDAKDQMERTLTTAKISSDQNRRIAEVMICCGLQVTRGVWGVKRGDKTVDAFGPWNRPTHDFDATDWETAAQNETLYRMAPALLNFGTGKSRGRLAFADHAIDYRKKGPFRPYTDIRHPANLYPITLTDKDPVNFARHLVANDISLLIQLGSATADDRLLDIAIAGVQHGKISFFEAPFPDSEVKPGTYAAGAAALQKIDRLQRRIPILNTSPTTFETKTSYLVHKLRLQPERIVPNLGAVYTARAVREFYDHLEQNMVGELV